MRRNMLESLRDFTQAGSRKIAAWTSRHTTVQVPFNLPGDDPQGFANANTLAELHALDRAGLDICRFRPHPNAGPMRAATSESTQG